MSKYLPLSFLHGLGHKVNERFSSGKSIALLAFIISRVIGQDFVHQQFPIVIAEVNELAPIPIIGISIYLGLISGYVPSPLYERNGRWPREYAIFQVMLLILTASRLTRRVDIMQEVGAQGLEDGDESDDDDDDEYDLDLEELASFTHWMGSNLYKMFFSNKDGVAKVLIELVTESMDAVLFIWVFSKLANRYEWLGKVDAATKLPMALVFARNSILFVAITTLFIWDDMNDVDNSHFKFCNNEYKVAPGWIAPGYSLADITNEFTVAWKMFHPSDLWLVRMSHAVLYPSILLLLTRRRLTTFFIWVLFVEIDFFHMLADMVHYVSGPSLAEERLEFQGGAKDCYVNVYLFQTLFAYPMNFVYLATSLGDTPPSSHDY